MKAKINERSMAISLREQGKSYSEIVASVHVSQSTLSVWLKAVALTDKQVSSLADKKRAGQLKGGLARKSFRETKQKSIVNESIRDIKQLTIQDLWLAGIIAYWCEGTKQRETNISQAVVFTNSDPFLIRLFLKWLERCCGIEQQNLIFRLHIHESVKIYQALEYWSRELEVPIDNFSKTALKKHKILTNRKNKNENYHGLITVTVRKSTDLNRKIKGWVLGISNFLE